jgi:hypothetical protein
MEVNTSHNYHNINNNHWKVAWNFFIKLIVALVAVVARVSDCVVATNPNPTLWAP